MYFLNPSMRIHPSHLVQRSKELGPFQHVQHVKFTPCLVACGWFTCKMACGLRLAPIPSSHSWPAPVCGCEFTAGLLLLDGAREQKFKFWQLSGDFPLSHNKQKCKMIPNKNSAFNGRPNPSMRHPENWLGVSKSS